MLMTIAENIMVNLMVTSVSTTVFLIVILVVLLGLIGVGLLAARHIREHYH